jgi:hypothetical protein
MRLVGVKDVAPTSRSEDKRMVNAVSSRLTSGCRRTGLSGKHFAREKSKMLTTEARR